uniref:DUF4843 domain-containing protein n=1 Tax=Pedobacter schmidteae TaxID=2201271 RepID=UPI000EADF369|nr:DUF4843 domain-containing protein [Pedobacter schmidteae]
MKLELKYIWMLLSALLITSCKKDQFNFYSGTARIQFGPAPKYIYQSSYNFLDTLKSHTFYYDGPSVKQDTVFFDIYAIGGVSKSDRSFTLEQKQVPNKTNAVPGVHYIPFNDPRSNQYYVIKAGTVHTRVPVIVLRDAGLKSSTPVLMFEVIDNQHFKTGEPGKTWRKLFITDRLTRPASWDQDFSDYYFGPYSVTKHKLMIDITGQRWDEEFTDNAPNDYPKLKFFINKVKTALIDYEESHGEPLRDENDEIIYIP